MTIVGDGFAAVDMMVIVDVVVVIYCIDMLRE